MALKVRRTDGYSNRLAERLSTNRSNCTDFTIKVGRRSIPCHKIILIGNSPVLEKIILTDMLEATTGEVQLDQFPYSVMEAVITYMYTGSTTLSPDQLLDAVSITHFLELSDLHQQCIQHAPQVISPGNVIQWLQFATLHKLPNIITSAKQIIAKAFNEISLEQQFLDLSLAEVRDLINAAKTEKVQQDDLLKAVFRYISPNKEERTKDLDCLIQPIDLHNCSKTTMREIQDNYSEILTKNPAFFVKFFQCSIRDTEQGKTAAESCKSLSILVLGEGKEVWLLNNKDQFSEISKFPDDACQCFAACVIDQGVLVTGGWTGSVYSNKVFLLIPSTHQWKQLKNMRAAKGHHACVCCAGVCYVLGGYVSNSWSGNVQMLKVDTSHLENEQWRDAPQMPEVMYNPKASVLCGLTYLTEDSNTALYVFSPTTQAWSTKAQIPINPGQGYSMAAGREHLYVAGGLQKVCAMYSPVTDAWTVATNKPTLQHYYGAMVMRGQTMMLIGGYSADVEQYDIDQKVWSTLDVKLPKQLTHHQAVVVEME